MKKIKGLTLNGQYFTLPELLSFCKSKIKENSDPEWNLDIFRFIVDFFDDSTIVLQKTSGTTGSPKTINLSKQSMLISAKNTISYFKLKENDVAVLCLPVKYIAGKMMIIRSLIANMNLILTEPAGTPDFSGIKNIDFCAMVPMQAANLLQKNVWPKLKTLILGGAETGSHMIKQIQKVNTAVFATYGMAETCSHIALQKLNGKNPDSYFTLLPNIKISTDERDCLIIEADYLSEKIITNDRVELISPNQFKWLGRFDNVINSGGIKIQAEILEKQIQEILQKPCAISSIPDQVFGQKVILIVEAEKEMEEDLILEELSSFIDKKTMPKSIRFVKQIPRNKSFKTDRLKLKSMLYIYNR